MRVLVLTNVAAPYRVELFNRCNGVFERFHVAFQSNSEPGRKWTNGSHAFESSTLQSWRVGLGRRAILFTRGVSSKVREVDPNLVVASGFSPAVPSLLRECKRSQRKLVLLCDGTPETDPLSGLEFAYRRWLVKKADGFIAACRRSADYFCALGAAPSRVGIVELTTDLFALRASVLDDGRRTRARIRWKTGDQVACAAGKLVPGKRMRDVLMAYERARRRLPRLSLLIAGEGALEQELRSYATQHELSRVHFLGHLGWEEMLDFYAASDILLFPAVRERFGMVIIEALASGVPVIATLQAGATHDLLKDGENGFVVKPGDIEQMADCLVRFFESPSMRAEMSQEAAAVVGAHDVTIEAERFTSYLKEVGAA